MPLQSNDELPFPVLVRVPLYAAEADFLIETLHAAVVEASNRSDFTFGDWCTGRLAGLRRAQFFFGPPSAIDMTPYEGCLLIQQLAGEEKAATAAGRHGEAWRLAERSEAIREALR